MSRCKQNTFGNRRQKRNGDKKARTETHET